MTKILRGVAAEAWAYKYGKAIKEDRFDLWSWYKNPSHAKVYEYNDLVSYAIDNGYYGVRVVSANSFVFTVGYRNSKELVIETALNRYIIPIDTMIIKHFVDADF